MRLEVSEAIYLTFEKTLADVETTPEVDRNSKQPEPLFNNEGLSQLGLRLITNTIKCKADNY